jgi:RNA polymerase sigma-70 factor (ECF subfamily)
MPPAFDGMIRAARAGDRALLGQLLERCRDYLLRIAQEELSRELRGKFSGSDLVQQTFVQAIDHFGRFDGHREEQLLAWLRCILLNHLANLRRKIGGHEAGIGDTDISILRKALLASEKSPSSEARANEQDEALRRALERLPEDYRLAIQWRTYERCSFAEIGRRLERTPEAARRLWGRALERLRVVLEKPP